MRPELEQALVRGTPDYELLPKAIQQYYTPAEYLAIGDARRARLLREETEPELFEDGA
ncbi:hypothetical protein [Aromatoleum anaerobium]|uniref:Uncharacterized protein n=1 Tax=Aromatoleum anaerobium TaxID=182180 RepID=A0ABX1PRU0_9RHOO|nr:hypothetical protein [Aromatoleum anaerobium]MCK0507918.1 hypothetical protein [Aromatoleum anaerobium]